MAEQHEKEQEHHEKEQDNPPESTISSPSNDSVEGPSRPRPSVDHQETVQVGRERIFQRPPREMMRSRDIAEAARPLSSTSDAIQRQEKRSLKNQPSF